MLRTPAAGALRLRLGSQFTSRQRKEALNIATLSAKRHGLRGLGFREPTRLSLIVRQPLSTAVVRLDIDRKHEAILEAQKLEVHPEEVTLKSSVHRMLHEKGVVDHEDDVDMLAGIRSDMKTIKETFALDQVPKEALNIGLAGVLPYLATSMSTVYLAWDINHASLTGEGFLLSGPTAEALLHIIEPLQVGYGAVIISFLGAIHWGLEWAKYGGSQGYSRYAYGVVAPAVAWPTMLLPVEYALITQFCAFTFLYFADARAVIRGWAPHWYSSYRFVLTFVVGASIVVSLIGRGQIADKISRLPTPMDRVKALKDMQYDEIVQEELYKREHVDDEDEEEEDDEEAEEDEDDEEED